MSPREAAGETRFSTPIPISPGRLAFIDMPRPMTTAEWDQLLRVLDAMRPGLVAPESEGPNDGR